MTTTSSRRARTHLISTPDNPSNHPHQSSRHKSSSSCMYSRRPAASGLHPRYHSLQAAIRGCIRYIHATRRYSMMDSLTCETFVAISSYTSMDIHLPRTYMRVRKHHRHRPILNFRVSLLCSFVFIPCVQTSPQSSLSLMIAVFTGRRNHHYRSRYCSLHDPRQSYATRHGGAIQ